MKTLTLSLLALCLAMVTAGQQGTKAVDISRLRQAAPAVSADLPVFPLQAVNHTANTKSVRESILGGTRYDMQTNQAISSRICLFPDGTMSAAWTQGFQDPSFPDRGTGYNYFDGTSWGPAPTARIENIRTGWPCIQPWNGNGEIIVCHRSGTAEVVVETRPVKGTGAWTTSSLLPPPGATGIGWPRVLTSGVNYNFVHVILITTPVASGGTAYQGLDPALLYYRSSDGGATWDQQAVILPQLTSADYDGFSADSYAWGTAHGDTIYFAVGSPYVDTFIMQSNDNGTTWAKIPVLSNVNKKIPAGTTSLPEWKAADGSVAVEMDHSGVFHLAFGIGAGFVDAGSKYIVGNYNGLVYWNSTMPMIQDSLNLDTLDARGQLLGYVTNGPNPEDTIVGVPFYRVSLSSFPQISIDDNNDIYFIWSAATPGNPSPDPLNYRHLWGRVKVHTYTYMFPPVDLNEGIIYMFMEYVYGSMAKKTQNDNLQILYQTSSQPGSNIADNTVPVHDVSIEHRQVTKWSFFVGIKQADHPVNFAVGQNYPNPSNGETSFDLTLQLASVVSVEISNLMGQPLVKMENGPFLQGRHKITLDVSPLSPGIYFYTVKINGSKVTRKMIIG